MCRLGVTVTVTVTGAATQVTLRWLGSSRERDYDSRLWGAQGLASIVGQTLPRRRLYYRVLLQTELREALSNIGGESMARVHAYCELPFLKEAYFLVMEQTAEGRRIEVGGRCLQLIVSREVVKRMVMASWPDFLEKVPVGGEASDPRARIVSDELCFRWYVNRWPHVLRIMYIWDRMTCDAQGEFHGDLPVNERNHPWPNLYGAGEDRAPLFVSALLEILE